MVGHAIGHVAEIASHGVPHLNAFAGLLVTAVGSGSSVCSWVLPMVPLAE